MKNDEKIFEAIRSSGRYFEDEAMLKEYALSLNGSVCVPRAVVFPTSVEEICEIINYARQKKIEIFPVSKGKNWGYGTAQGTRENQIVLDLSKMNKILEVDKDLCTMTLQPGVTQGEAYQFLNSSDEYKGLQLDVTGAGSEASIVGNVLERGFGHTDYGNRFEHVINLKVVLGTGEVINTGFSSFENAIAQKTFRYGVGPMIDGLFSQSNFGVVVEMTIELMPKPEKFTMFVCSVKEEGDLSNIILAVRQLRLEKTLNCTIHIANKSRTIGEKESKWVSEWTLAGSVSGPAELVKSRKARVKKVFKTFLKSHKLRFVNDGTLNLLKKIHSFRPLEFYNDLMYVVDLQKGIPTNEPIRILMNSSEKKPSFKTSEFPMHFKWIASVSTAEPERVNGLMEILKRNFEEWGYDFRVTLTSINPRTLTFISNISYLKDPESIQKANEFYNSLMSQLVESGYYPYRSGSGMYDFFEHREESTSNLLHKMKSALDPDGILAPGRYGIN